MRSLLLHMIEAKKMLKTTAASVVGPVLLGVASISLPLQASTIDVNTTVDEIADDGQCSLREAVIASNTDTASGVVAGECVAGSGTDTIVLQAETYKLTRGGGGEDAALVGDLDILESVSIQGAGQEDTLIYGNDIDRVFHVRNLPEVTTVMMSDLIVSHGTVSGKGGAILSRKTLILNSVSIFKSTAEDGGGIFSSGDLQMTSCLVSDNVSQDDGGAIYVASGSLATIRDTEIIGQVTGGTGGGIYNAGSLALDTSTVELNQSVWGGGIHTMGDLEIVESTIAFNEVLRWGAGLANEGSATITNSTVSSNTAVEFAGNIANMAGGDLDLVHSTVADGVAPVGSAVQNDAVMSTANSIFKGSCDGTGLNSLGGNVESPGNTCNLNRFRDRKFQTDEELDLLGLGDHGGPTWTHLLGRNSVAVDRALFSNCTATDQRGVARPIDGNADGRDQCDSGSYEYSLEFFSDGFETGDTSRWAFERPE